MIGEQQGIVTQRRHILMTLLQQKKEAEEKGEQVEVSRLLREINAETEAIQREIQDLREQLLTNFLKEDQ